MNELPLFQALQFSGAIVADNQNEIKQRGTVAGSRLINGSLITLWLLHVRCELNNILEFKQKK